MNIRRIDVGMYKDEGEYGDELNTYRRIQSRILSLRIRRR